MTTRSTHRLRGVSALALLAGGLGVLAARPALLLPAVVAVVFAAAARTARPPTPDLAVERSVDDDDPAPGDEVAVTVTLRNEGSTTLPDLRFVDGVPDSLAVSSGSPRLGTALRPGAEVRLRYAVTAERGAHAFEPALVLARDFSGSVERELRVPVETTVTCRPRIAAAEAAPLRPQTSRYTGRVLTDVGGSGVEFFATREYRPGDSLSRIDWKRRARTGELATLEFREERAASVVLLIDTREQAYVSSDEEGPSAVDHAVDAAGRVFAALLDAGDQVGLAAFGPRSCWLGPGAGEEHRARARDLLGLDDAFSPLPPEGPFHPSLTLLTLRRRLSADAQVVLFSPLGDDYVADVARRLDAYGHAVTVVSPDATSADTSGRRLARAERAYRLGGLREAGLRVVDWSPDEPLEAAFERARAGWAR